MRVKVFGARSRKDLEEKLNDWLTTHPVSPDGMHVEFAATYCDDPQEHIIEMTLVLFYIPMMPIA